MKKKILVYSSIGVALLIPALAMVFSLGIASVPVTADAGADTFYSGFYGVTDECYLVPHNNGNDNNGRNSDGPQPSSGAADGAKVTTHDSGLDFDAICNECGGAIKTWSKTKIHPDVDSGTLSFGICDDN